MGVNRPLFYYSHPELPQVRVMRRARASHVAFRRSLMIPVYNKIDIGVIDVGIILCEFYGYVSFKHLLSNVKTS